MLSDKTRLYYEGQNSLALIKNSYIFRTNFRRAVTFGIASILTISSTLFYYFSKYEKKPEELIELNKLKQEVIQVETHILNPLKKEMITIEEKLSNEKDRLLSDLKMYMEIDSLIKDTYEKINPVQRKIDSLETLPVITSYYEKKNNKENIVLYGLGLSFVFLSIGSYYAAKKDCIIKTNK